MSDPEDGRERARRRFAARADGGDGNGPADASPGEPIHVEGADHLDELTATYDLVLVAFYVRWNGPSRLLDPVVETIAGGTPAAVARVDVDRRERLADRADVRGLPTLVLFAEGEPFERRVDLQDEATLRRLIDRYA